MWAQSWANIGDFSVPYPGKTTIDISDELVKQVRRISLFCYYRTLDSMPGIYRLFFLFLCL